MITSKSGYPLNLNGWSLIDNESMLYSKEADGAHHFIDITWLDTTRDDPNYGTGREYCVCLSEEDGDVDFEDALERFQDEHHTE